MKRLGDITKIRAWLAWAVDSDYDGPVVFAETRGKAHYIAMQSEECEGYDWNNVMVRRFPQMDSMWKPGKVQMDWYNPEDRIALVKANWHCEYPQEWECKVCPAAEWCIAKENAESWW